jgi:TRAP-type mannitol/chloroaromatic compound transport system permease small subunit
VTALLAISRLIDRINEWIGKLVIWLVLVMVLISAGNAIARKAFDLSCCATAMCASTCCRGGCPSAPTPSSTSWAW